MTLLMDSGNTRLKLVRMQQGADIASTDVIAWAYADANFEAKLADFLSHYQGSRHCFLASVAAGMWQEKIQEHLKAQNFEVTRVFTEPYALGVKNAYLHPARMGVDRFLAMIAAQNHIQKNLLIVSVGTALTLDLLDSTGQHHGGVIAAGESFVYHSMSTQFSVFKDLNGKPGSFSNTTDDALATGLRWMQIGTIEKALQEAKKTGMNDVSLLLCGGGAESLLKDLPAQTLYRPHLVLEGLALWAQAHS